MSRIGKQQLVIPPKTEVNVSGNKITVKGPGGTLSRDFRPDVAVVVEEGHIRVNPLKEDKQTRSLWGTTASHIENMIIGVNKPFEKQLILEGVGFKSEVSGKTLVLALGFSHGVKENIPEGLTVKAEKNVITITGINIEQVGQFAAHIRQLKKPEPYKGKGFRYRDEVIRRKEGKKSV